MPGPYPEIVTDTLWDFLALIPREDLPRDLPTEESDIKELAEVCIEAGVGNGSVPIEAQHTLIKVLRRAGIHFDICAFVSEPNFGGRENNTEADP